MIVGYQPGGTIRDARVVLRPNETLPNSFNVIGTVVYREDPDDLKLWILVKEKDLLLPADSPLLSQPQAVHVDIKDLTNAPEGDTFNHADIIHLDE